LGHIGQRDGHGCGKAQQRCHGQDRAGGGAHTSAEVVSHVVHVSSRGSNLTRELRSGAAKVGIAV